MATKNNSIKLNYSEEKVKAIKVALNEKGKDFDAEIVKFLDGLYEKNVPKLLKKYIENGQENNEQIKSKNLDNI